MQQPTIKPRRSLLSKVLIGSAALVVACCGLSAIGALFAPRSATPTPTQSPASAVRVVDEAPHTSTPTMPPATAAPTATPAGYISKSMFGDKWPLSVEDGVVQCRYGSHVVFVAGGKVYAVNGIASGAMKAGKEDYVDIREIWVDDARPGHEGLKISITPVIDAGLKLC